MRKRVSTATALKGPSPRLELRRLVLAVAASSLIWLAGTARAADNPQVSQQTAQPASFKYYVWGEVRSPGVYRLGPSLDIVELLSAAGGPTQAADLTKVALVQGFDQRRTTLNIRKALESGSVISLSPGDIVIVPKSLGYSIREEITWISTIIVALNLYFTIANLFRE